MIFFSIVFLDLTLIYFRIFRLVKQVARGIAIEKHALALQYNRYLPISMKKELKGFEEIEEPDISAEAIGVLHHASEVYMTRELNIRNLFFLLKIFDYIEHLMYLT